MTLRFRELIVESEKFSMNIIINVSILMNAQTLSAGQMKGALILTAVIVVSVLVMLAINSTISVQLFLFYFSFDSLSTRTRNKH
jgi:hypothetical protein